MGNGRSPKTAETEAITSQPFMAHNDLCYYSASVKLATRIDLWGEISLYAHPFLLTRFRNSILTTLDENHCVFKNAFVDCRSNDGTSTRRNKDQQIRKDTDDIAYSYPYLAEESSLSSALRVSEFGYFSLLFDFYSRSSAF